MAGGALELLHISVWPSSQHTIIPVDFPMIYVLGYVFLDAHFW